MDSLGALVVTAGSVALGVIVYLVNLHVNSRSRGAIFLED